MNICSNIIEWCDTIYEISWRADARGQLLNLKFILSYYVACNSTIWHSSGVDDIAWLHLQETFSLSVITYVIPALDLTTRQFLLE